MVHRRRSPPARTEGGPPGIAFRFFRRGRRAVEALQAPCQERLILVSSRDRSHRLPGWPGNRGQSKPSQTGGPAMQPWFIPMAYVSGAVAGWARAAANRAGLSLQLHHRHVGGLGPGAALGRRVGDDGADRNRFRDGLRDGAVQRDRLFPAARALVRARPDAVPRTGNVHRDIRLRSVHARLGGPRRFGKGPAVLGASRQES